MHAKRPLAVLLGAAGASMSAGASFRYLGDEPATPSPATALPIDVHSVTTTTPTLTTDNARKKLAPTAVLSKRELGLDQSLARDVACWISAASVYTARQAFYASALPLSLPIGPEHADASTKRALSASGTLDSPQTLTVGGRAGMYHALFGWLHDLSPTAAHWDAQRVLASTSFTMLLNAVSSSSASASTPERDVLERELFRAVGALATDAQCARAIAERATRYGKRALLHCAQRHDDDPRVGTALQRLVLLDDAAGCRFGPAHLESLLALAVARSALPDEYVEFALWALRRAASPAAAHEPLRYAWRRTLFGADARAATRRKLRANDALWAALFADSVLEHSDRVQFQAARLLNELLADSSDRSMILQALQRHDPQQRVLLQWLQAPSVPLACAALDIVTEVARTDDSIRCELVAAGALDVLRMRLVADDSDCRLTTRLLRAVHALACDGPDGATATALDAHALSFADDSSDGDDDSDADDLQPLHADDFVAPANNRRTTQSHSDSGGWLALLTKHVRARDPAVREQATACLAVLAAPAAAHSAQTQLTWLHAVLDAALEAVPHELATASASVRLARKHSRPIGGHRTSLPESSQFAYDVALAQALRALAHVADQHAGQLALAHHGGAALLSRLAASNSVAVQRETARVVANVLASAAPLPSGLADVAAATSPLAAALDRWTLSTDVPLQAAAHRARVNRRRHALATSVDSAGTNTKADTGTGRVTYVDGVHPLHLHSAAATWNTTDDDAAYDVDVVFVHGLLGCPFETWMCGDDAESVWARAWLLPDLAQAGRTPRVLSVAYDAQLLAGDSAWQTLGFQSTSDALAQQLAAARVGAGGRPVVFVTHSLGGVLLKQVLHDSAARRDVDVPTPSLVDSVRGVVFYGVPHRGSPVAQTIRALWPQSLGLTQHPVTEHLHGSAHAAMLNDSCAALFAARGIAALSVGETLPCRLPVVGLETLVVPPESANPGFGRFVAVPGTTHMSVCKPSTSDDERYRLAKDFIVECVAAPSVATDTFVITNAATAAALALASAN